jgi:hypothetical protein
VQVFADSPTLIGVVELAVFTVGLGLGVTLARLRRPLPPVLARPTSPPQLRVVLGGLAHDATPQRAPAGS